ncbi:MAG: DUF1638 domain-containing protein, partial [Planctomycetota bacterium]
LKEYKEKYGDDNAQYLMEVEQSWMKEYSWATFVDWGLNDSGEYKNYTKRCAEYLHWNYEELKGDPALMQKLIDGDWNESEFLVVKPGQKIGEDLTNDGIMKAE